MTKKDKLKKLDEDILDSMMTMVAEKNFEDIPLLSTAINYLKANEITEERERDTAEDEVKRKVKEANERREPKV
jgi:hypothetical protein